MQPGPGYRLSPDLSPNGQANASSWLGTKNALYYCAQSDSWQPRKRRRKSEYTFFSLYRDYSNSLTLSNASELVWSWMSINHIQVYKEKQKFRHCLFTSSTKREIGHYHLVVVQWRQRNVQKSVMHVQSCCFALSSYSFFCFLVAAAS